MRLDKKTDLVVSTSTDGTVPRKETGIEERSNSEIGFSILSPVIHMRLHDV